MEKTTKHQLLQLLSASETDAAIAQLLALIPLTEIADIKEEITILSSRHEQLEKDRRTDVISYQQFQTSNNKLTRDITEFVNNINFSGNKIEYINSPTPPFIQKKYSKKILYLSAVIFAGIFIWKMFFPPGPTASFQQTIYVHGPESRSHEVTSDKDLVMATFDDRRESKPINNGKSNFEGIAKDFYKKRIEIGVRSKLYEPVEPKKLYLFDGEPIYVEVKIKEEYLIIHGTVKEIFSPNKYIEGATILVENRHKAMADKNGWFEIILPQEAYQESYKLEVIKEGYRKISTKYFPTKPIDIRLQKL